VHRRVPGYRSQPAKVNSNDCRPWAEIRRLHEIEKVSGRKIALRLDCSRDTLARALRLDQPPTKQRATRAGLVDPFRAKTDALLARWPNLSAVSIHEEISKPPEGYSGGVIVLRRYLRKIRPARGRVYQRITNRRRRCRSIGANAADVVAA
jgi:hypothetical protein